MNVRRVRLLAAMMLVVAVMLAGCGGGKPDSNSVAKQLSGKAEKLESYSTKGLMTLHTGLEPEQYEVEVWFKKPSYYRIKLSSPKRGISQIVLRNDDGVFVLTPHLGKSFRFQSDWPGNQGQVYLYQSLVGSVLNDNDRRFTTDGDSYVYDVAANYQNASLVRQKIWFNQKTLSPQHVEVSDAGNQVLVAMDFNDFQFDVSFDPDAFDMQRNMNAENLLTVPVLSGNGEEEAAGQKPETTDSPYLAVLVPGYIPEGVGQPKLSEVKIAGEDGVLLEYEGTYRYNLLITRPNDKPVSLTQGEVVDLGHTFGVLAGEERKTLVWMVDGTEFRLSSGDLPLQEMIKIALSVYDQSPK